MSVCQGCSAELPPNRGPGQKRKWCSERCRRHTIYSRPCADCGTPTYDGSANPPERCVPCHARTRVIWTPEAIIDAIREFADRYGQPPAACDWNTGMSYGMKAKDFWADACWPQSQTVQAAFGSWNAAIAAAGFTPRGVGKRGPGRRVAVAA